CIGDVRPARPGIRPTREHRSAGPDHLPGAASSGAEDAYLNGRTQTGIGFCPSAIGRPEPVLLIVIIIEIYDNILLCSITGTGSNGTENRHKPCGAWKT